jgi:hypothetical protein
MENLIIRAKLLREWRGLGQGAEGRELGDEGRGLGVEGKR